MLFNSSAQPPGFHQQPESRRALTVMELLADLPPGLHGLMCTLSSEATAMQVARTLELQLQQAQSPLSVVRQAAYSSIAACLESQLSGPGAGGGATLGALRSAWPPLLARILAALAQAQAAAAAAAAGALRQQGRGGGGGGQPEWGGPSSARGVGPGELAAQVLVLQAGCILSAAARQAAHAAGAAPLLLGALRGAPPPLAMGCLDALLALQLDNPQAFVEFVERRGVQQVCQLLQARDTPERVRGQAAQFLNLLLTQLAPSLAPAAGPAPAAGGAAPSPTLPGGSSSPLPTTPGSAHPPPWGAADAAPAPAATAAAAAADPGQAAAVARAREAAGEALAAALGREARALLLRRVSLSDPQLGPKLEQLGAALTLFVEPDGA